MPVALLRMLSVTPGITAACVSVTVPWSVAVDCAADGAADARTNTRLRGPMADMKATTRLICDFSLRRDLATGCCAKPNGERWREPNEYDGRFQLSTKDLQRHVAVLLRRVLIALVIQILERLYEFLTRLPRVDHLIEEAGARRDVGVRELRAKLRDLLGARGRGIGRGIEFALVEDIDGALRPHHGELRG